MKTKRSVVNDPNVPNFLLYLQILKWIRNFSPS